MHHNMKVMQHQKRYFNQVLLFWLKDALDGYDYLVEQGYDEIVVAGLSLGGDFAFKIKLKSRM